MTKYIIVKWVPDNSFYGNFMKVIDSTHPRFTNGTRFDYGFLDLASSEGYVITVLPMEKMG